MQSKRSQELFDRARAVTPGGVFDSQRKTEPAMIAFSRGAGSHAWDVDGNEYVDYHLAFGPLVLGHCHPEVMKAVKAQVEVSDIWNAGILEQEVQVAEKIAHHVPSAEKVRFAVSGSDGIFTAIRIAKGFTKRKKIVKFIGGYHGTNDNVMVDIAPAFGKSTGPHLEAEGVDERVAETTITVPYNDEAALSRVFKENKGEIAAVLAEPVMHSAVGCIKPQEGFLEFLREITQRNDSLLVFDEVITGFRHAIGGAQSLFKIVPDLTVFAKALANGFPIAVVCGRGDVMDELRPVGNVMDLGTYLAHPVSLAAAKVTIAVLETGKPYEQMIAASESVQKGISASIEELGIDAHVSGFRSIFVVYFTRHEIRRYSDLSHINLVAAKKFKIDLMSKGILTLPLPIKRMHVSAVHSKTDVEKMIDVCHEVLQGLKARQLVAKA
jgi:glutamate-1-semialdehyde 2,1-aminomutase